MSNTLQVRARFIGCLILFLLGSWVLHGFFDLLAWAVVLAIATWPVYERLLASTELNGKVTWVALSLTFLIGAIIMAPFGYGVSRLLEEVETLGQLFTHAQNVGISPPDWLETLPVIGHWLKENWLKVLGDSETFNGSLQWLASAKTFNFTKELAGQLVSRFFGFLIILLVLFLVYQHGNNLGRQVLASSNKLFGEKGCRYFLHATAAVRSTVNGMMLIGLGKGVLMGFGYAFVGLDNPAILGALTGFFAIIPFAAKLVFSVCALVLVAKGHPVEAGSLFIYGMTLTLIADNYIRPALIGGAVKLPFIWTLLGIFGGLETFGLLGLFLGPVLLAVLMTLWRDWIAALDSLSKTNDQ